MSRPHKCRLVDAQPRVTAFKPSGVRGHEIETVELGLDELEALRLADVEGLYQDAAAERMGISRATFSRLIQNARQKVATALLEGEMLVFQGGPITVAAAEVRTFMCGDCTATFQLPYGTGQPAACPSCNSPHVFREDGERGYGHRRRRGRGGWQRAMNGAVSAPGQRRQWGRSTGGPQPPAQNKGE